MKEEEPHPRPIVIFFEGGFEFLEKYVVRDLPYVLFKPFEELEKVSFGNVLSFFKFFISDFFKLKVFSLKPDALKFIYKHLRARLLLDEINKKNPSCLLTYIDNNDFFHAISRLSPSWPTIAIQNGGRYIWCATEALASPMEKYHIDEYYCFGEQTQELFKNYKHEIQSYKKHGSLLGGVFFSRLDHTETKYDICLISQWSKNVCNKKNLPIAWENLEVSIERLVVMLAKFQKEKNIRVCIALRSSPENDEDEKKFYRRFFKNNVHLLENIRGEFSSYSALGKSNLVVALNSTLASEAFGAGCKVLFVNPLGEAWLKPVEIEGEWYLESPSEEDFSKRVDMLLNMPKEDYLRLASPSINYSMSYNSSLPLHDAIYLRLKTLYTEPLKKDIK